MSRELAAAFNAAADYIETNGWWNGTIGSMRTDTPSSTCIANSLVIANKAVEDGEYRTYETPNGERFNVVDAQDALVAHFGVEQLSDVFDLNDAHSYDTGKEWATRNLREIANSL